MVSLARVCWSGLAATLLSVAWAGPVYADAAAGLRQFQAGRFSEAFIDWRADADHGDVPAALYLGVLYDTGFGVPQDDRQALAWYEIAAAGGNRTAMFNAAVMYDAARGTKRDPAAAVAWYERAAAAGNGRAEYNLGLIYEAGDGVPADRARAVRFYRAAVGHGIGAAQPHLVALGAAGATRHASAPRPTDDPAMANFARAQSVLLARGPVQATEAVGLFRKAAEEGNALAAYNLAYCYEHGLGVKPNMDQALAWYRRSAAIAGDGPIGEIASAGVRNLMSSGSQAQR